MTKTPKRRRIEPGFERPRRRATSDGDLRGERLDMRSEAEEGAKKKQHRRARTSSGGGFSGREGAKGAGSGGGRPGGWGGRLARWSLMFAIWGVVLVAGIVAYYALDLPDVDNYAALTRRPSVTLLADDGRPFASFGDLYDQVVPLKDMPPYLPEAVIATEDRRFYRHFGIDPIGMLRALAADVRSGAIREGGSTITQQLAKNLFLSPARTLKRKVQEVLLALWLEHKFTKDQILTIYLNRVYLGANAYGVDAAAHRYFGKSARDLTLYQSAVIAGLLKAPSKFNPFANPDLTAARAAQVLANMADAGYITPSQAALAERARENLKPAAVAAWRGRYFADWVLDQVHDILGYVERDLVVQTTYDARLQALAEDTLAGTLEKEGSKLDIGQGALVALQPNGAVEALVGGRDYRASQFDRATQALRQPGSAFKPFIYLAGLEAGYGPDDVFDDAPITIGKWRPNNYDDKYFGRVPLKFALAHSLNSIAAQLADKVGVKHVIEVARRLGITSDLRPDLSLALGTSEVGLLELTGAYGAFADGGLGVWPYGVVEIRDRAGTVLYKRSGSGPGDVMTPKQAATMDRMMEGVIAEGTGRAANIGRPAAGKTGTTQDYRDAWFVGFTPNLVTGVWVGNDDGTPMKRVTGGSVPAHIWHDFMAAALAGTPPQAFAAPPTLFESVLQSILGGSSSKTPAPETSEIPPPSPSTPTDQPPLPGGLTKM
jgi:penicillin-binding protein 1A